MFFVTFIFLYFRKWTNIGYINQPGFDTISQSYIINWEKGMSATLKSYRKMSGSEIFRSAGSGGPKNQSPLEGRDTVEGGF